jgi:hypothetical protein
MGDTVVHNFTALGVGITDGQTQSSSAYVKKKCFEMDEWARLHEQLLLTTGNCYFHY